MQKATDVDSDTYNAGRAEGRADIVALLRRLVDPEDMHHWNADGVLRAVATLAGRSADETRTTMKEAGYDVSSWPERGGKMKRTYHLHADDVTADVSPKTPPPGGVPFRVFEILVRDPERSFGRWCSAKAQQTAELFRYEVEYEIPDDPDLSTDLSEWAGDLEIDLMAETEEMYREVWFDSTTFNDWPHAVVEVEVDDEDLEGLDKTGYACSKKFLDRLAEDESGQPTLVPRPSAPSGAKESA